MLLPLFCHNHSRLLKQQRKQITSRCVAIMPLTLPHSLQQQTSPVNHRGGSNPPQASLPTNQIAILHPHIWSQFSPRIAVLNSLSKKLCPGHLRSSPIAQGSESTG